MGRTLQAEERACTEVGGRKERDPPKGLVDRPVGLREVWIWAREPGEGIDRCKQGVKSPVGWWQRKDALPWR